MIARAWQLSLIALALGLWLAGCSTQRAAPSVDLELLDGESVSLDSLADGPVLLTFWATSCPGCVEEIPVLKALHADYADRGLTVVGVAMEYDPPEQVRELVRRREIDYPVALDRDGSDAAAFGAQLTPTSYLISPEGRIVFQKIGVFDPARVRGLIEGLL